MSEWMDIASAPKDGSEILAWHPSGHVHPVSWEVITSGGFWLQTVAMFEHPWDADAFTHWQPLPAPPDTRKE